MLTAMCHAHARCLATERRAAIGALCKSTPIMLGLSSTLALAPIDVSASNLVVTNCLDDGSVGSLRYQVAHAVNSDVIDLSTNQLACSSITLTNGAISESLYGVLTIKGPTDRAFTITAGGNAYRIFAATGPVTSVLNIYNLIASGGVSYGYSGGCIYSHGYVQLTDVIVDNCFAYTGDSRTINGGGIYARSLKMTRSRVSGSEAYSGLGNANGGGAFAYVSIQADYVTVSGNRAITRGAGNSTGGGMKVKEGAGGVTAQNSIIDSNYAVRGGGISASHLHLNNCTISGNAALVEGGGAYVTFAGLFSSTIAFNSAAQTAGVRQTSASPGSFAAYSTIIARNTNTAPGGSADFYSGAALSGQKNLVTSYNVASSAITITSDPQLAPLAFHGGPTRTHALLSTSPAVDHGYPLLQDWDQRGPGFPRAAPVGKPDIGAYERHPNDDELFYSGFD